MYAIKQQKVSGVRTVKKVNTINQAYDFMLSKTKKGINYEFSFDANKSNKINGIMLRIFDKYGSASIIYYTEKI